ncbi:MAG TPA: hypothetical protein DHV48_20925 [Prolixibacteraceae bacterium]|nr:MAG: hypothetical protein A2066_07520 [Bacteroidetes bacterium GWB2_41_8]HCY43766.1 hypothetical protein [Prolixibacteraceae bacterium]
MDFPELVDFSKHRNNPVKYFARTAACRKVVNIDSGLWGNGQKIVFYLGEMNDIAEVKSM